MLENSGRYITRPNISYVIQQVCLFMHAPHEPHYNFLKLIIYYLQGTLDFSIKITPTRLDSLMAYFDVDWTGWVITYCVYLYLGDNVLS